MTDIATFFNPENESHRDAFEHLCGEGEWPILFIQTWPHDMEEHPSWITAIYHKMYMYHTKEVTKLRHILSFYADPANYADTVLGKTFVEMDNGCQADKVLWGPASK